MIALLLVLAGCGFAPECHLQAGVIKSSLSQPRAEIYVQFMEPDCGDKPPTFESETATVWDVTEDVPEGEDPAKECEDNDCPYLTFKATVTGPVGKHEVSIYAENEGAAQIRVTLRGWK